MNEKLKELFWNEKILMILIFIIIPVVIGLIVAIVFSLTGYDFGGKIIVNQFISDWLGISVIAEIVVMAVVVAVSLYMTLNRK